MGEERAVGGLVVMESLKQGEVHSQRADVGDATRLGSSDLLSPLLPGPPPVIVQKEDKGLVRIYFHFGNISPFTKLQLIPHRLHFLNSISYVLSDIL